jgi:hypothetical protein
MYSAGHPSGTAAADPWRKSAFNMRHMRTHVHVILVPPGGAERGVESGTQADVYAVRNGGLLFYSNYIILLALINQLALRKQWMPVRPLPLGGGGRYIRRHAPA